MREKLILILFAYCPAFSYSQDIKAGEITLEYLGSLTYKAQVTFYYDSTLYSARPFILLSWGDNITDTLLFAGATVAPCVLPNTMVSVYTGVHSYSSYGNFVISCTDSFRINSINNINNSGNESMRLEYYLNINPTLGINNNSPISFGCLVNEWECCSWSFNSACYDSDGDSLGYSLIPPIVSNYTFPPAATVDSNGTITFNPADTGNYSICLRIDEWRVINQNHYLIGSSFRNLLIDIQSLVSVDEIEKQKNKYVIFPNPSDGKYFLSCPEEDCLNYNINVFDISGRKIFSSAFSNFINLDLSEFENGIYIVEIANGEKTWNQKVIKK